MCVARNVTPSNANVEASLTWPTLEKMSLEQKIAPRPLNAEVACARTEHPIHEEPDHSDDSDVGGVGESTF